MKSIKYNQETKSFSEVDNKLYSESSDLKTLLTKLSEVEYDDITEISDDQWDKFDKYNNTDRSAMMIIQSAIGNSKIDQWWISNVIDELKNVSRNTGTELSMYVEYSRKLINFIKSKGTKYYSNSRIFSEVSNKLYSFDLRRVEINATNSKEYKMAYERYKKYGKLLRTAKDEISAKRYDMLADVATMDMEIIRLQLILNEVTRNVTDEIQKLMKERNELDDKIDELV